MGPDIDAFLAVFDVPLLLHFDGTDILLDTPEALRAYMIRYRAGMKANAVTQVVPMVGEIEPGRHGRLRVEVVWHALANGAPVAVPSEYFIDRGGGAPKIGMADFRTALPDGFEAFVFLPE